MKEFQPYLNLWQTANRWSENKVKWLQGPWNELDGGETEKFVEERQRLLMATTRHFKQRNQKAIQKIVEEVKAQIDEFRPKVPLMVALRKEGMHNRHWKAISEEVKLEIRPGPGFNFKKVLDLGLLDHLEFCVTLGERAYKEHGIRKMLDEMSKEWETIEFEMLKHKKTYKIKVSLNELS